MPRKNRYFLLALFAVAVVAIVCFELEAHEPTYTPIAGVDRVVVIKHEHRLQLWAGSQLVATYRVALGRGGTGPKRRAGDDLVQEGIYTVVSHNPHSAFHNALRLSYPSPKDQAAARAQGVDPGGDIMIHGIRDRLGWLGGLQTAVDWTKGCIALTDSQIDMVAREVPDGTPVEIRP